MHGGLSPDLKDFNMVSRILWPTDVPDSGILCDLLWSDPDENCENWAENERGVSYIFSKWILSQFIKNNDLDLIVWAH